jgi:hypothetical protein
MAQRWSAGSAADGRCMQRTTSRPLLVLDLVAAVRDLYVSSETAFVVLLGAAILAPWLTGRVALLRLAIELPLALVAAEGLARLLAPLIERPSPFVAHPALLAPLGSAGADPSFPSDGATAAFASRPWSRSLAAAWPYRPT